MKKFFFQFTALIIIILVTLYLGVNGNKSNFSLFPLQQKPALKVVTINDAKINVEIADTQDKRAKGLGGRDSLATGSGMLFIFPKADRYSFWMKGTKFPLDII